MFIKNDNGFICQQCKKKVNRLGYTSRNHCPYCLYSLHVDVEPGDRNEDCKGLMQPISVEKNKKGELVLLFKCEKCGAIKRNIIAQDDDKDVLYMIVENNAKNRVGGKNDRIKK